MEGTLMTKTRTGLLAIMATVVMLFAMAVAAVPALAAQGTITITPPSNTQTGTMNEYKVYKVFDATGDGTNISYKLPSGKTLTGDMGTYFSADTAGNITARDAAKDASEQLTAGAISAIATFVANDEPVATVTSSGTNPATAKELDNGYYYITTSTGSVVTVTSTNPNAAVNDKNTVPSVTKQITNVEDNAGSVTTDGKAAIVQAGKKVTYKATVTFGKGSKSVKFHDAMDTNLELSATGNVSVAIKDKNNETISGDVLYTVQQTPDNGDTITISFADGRNEGDYAEITYSATVKSSALHTTPAKNNAWVTYGDKPSSTNHVDTEVYNAQFRVLKHTGTGENLGGAGFVLKNSQGKYYKLSGDVVSWEENESDATEMTSDKSTGYTPYFVGLPDGTYTLIEKTVPSGYNKAADSTFTVKGVAQSTVTQAKAADGALYATADGSNATIANLNQQSTVVNNAGQALPTTGGPGTTLMYIIGAALVIAAAVALIARRKSRQQ
jgi:fimbrial isopeptide formation D2 family protein/LPXTG-motif cell wall-anchored protein